MLVPFLCQVQKFIKSIPAGGQGQLFGGGHGQLLQLLLAVGQGLGADALGVLAGGGDDLVRLLLGAVQLLLGGCLGDLLAFGPALPQLVLQLVQLGLVAGGQLFSLGQLLGGSGVHLGIAGGALVHELLYRAVQDKIQPAGQDDEVEHVQKDLLQVDIQGEIHN